MAGILDSLRKMITPEQRKKMVIDYLKNSSERHSKELNEKERTSEEVKCTPQKIHYLISFSENGEPYFHLFKGEKKIRQITIEEIFK